MMAEQNHGVPEDRCMLYRIGINLGDILIDGSRRGDEDASAILNGSRIRRA